MIDCCNHLYAFYEHKADAHSELRQMCFSDSSLAQNSEIDLPSVSCIKCLQ